MSMSSTRSLQAGAPREPHRRIRGGDVGRLVDNPLHRDERGVSVCAPQTREPTEAHRRFEQLQRPYSSRLVPSDYKALCADIVARLRAYRRLSDSLDEIALSRSDYVQEALEAAALVLAADWKAFSEQAAGILSPYLRDTQRVSAMRAFTQAVVTAELSDGAIWRRAFEKPRGYPGDYGVMSYCYVPEWVGETTYARLCHRLGLDFAQCVRTRKDVVREVIRERLQRQPTLSLMSIACGSAHEIFELASTGSINNSLDATLVDQDPEALSFAAGRLISYLSPEAPRFNATTVRAQFGDYSDPNGNSLPGGQDIVYCFGMFDYLPDDVISGIVPVLYSKLKAGGTMILGNLRPAPEMIWPLCFVLGYDMWFRGSSEMLAMAAPLSRCRAELRVEPTGYNYLLFLHRQ
jgi:extracellular factor (EF) 3-hydroxypalmitic acid methyl ester biosynthesis protein